MKKVLGAGILWMAMASLAQAQSSEGDFHERISSLSEEDQIEVLMGTGDPVNLYNFEKGEKESIHRIDKVSSEKFEEFLPPLPEVKAMYRLYVAHGLTPYEAYSQSMSQLMITLTEQ